ncbi:MAG: DedA family protein [Acidobacteriota bacterium]|nr:DedA family protein [Acidobacteriota bacterium]
MLIDASVTAQLVTFATNVVHDLGYAGVTLMIVMSQVVIVPGTEATMLFAGFNVDTHNLTLVGAIVAGVLGDVIGASICYVIGYFGLHEVLARPGSPVHIDERRIDTAHRWFERYGAPVVAVSRLIPVFRSAPPYAAGIARMPYWRFVSMATLGSIVWITGWTLVGKAVGHQWQQWKHHLDYVDYAVVAIVVLAVVWLVARWLRNRRTTAV